MSKPLKKMVSDYLRDRYDGVDSACVVDLTGLNVLDTQAVRRGMAGKKMRMEVIKNSMARLAFSESPLGPLAEALRGPSALVTGGDSIVDVAKALMEWSKEFKALTPKEAMVEGDPDLLTVADLSRMKGRAELYADLAMLIGSPGRAIAGCLSSPQGKIAGCLKAIADGEAGKE